MDKIRIGIFGTGRGSSFIASIIANGGEIVALCDKNNEKMKVAIERIGSDVKCYNDFDEFIEHPMDAVLLCNYFHEHAPYAIRCLEKNIHVISECTANSTLAEGVALVRAAEKSKAFYMLCENYPFMLFNREMKRICEGGTLGKILYGEGEYNHAGNSYSDASKKDLFDSVEHWRNFLPRTYYITHSLAPIAYATGALPVRVTAMPVFAPAPEDSNSAAHVGEIAAIITCLNDDKSVFKVTGHASFGASYNSYRVCGKKGQFENVRGTDNMVMLRYNKWSTPEGMEEINYYKPDLGDANIEALKKAGHGGGDFFVIREFLNCIRENRRPTMDVYFATRLASTAIMAHRSLMEYGVPYDVPDFRNPEDCAKYENDTLSPFYYSDGREPTFPCCSDPEYKPSAQQIENFKKLI